MPQRVVTQFGEARVAAMARVGQVDVQLGDDSCGARPEHDHALREEQRFLDIVRDEQRGEAVALPQCGGSACIVSRVSESSLPSGSSRISRRGSLTSARASATRCAIPPDN